MNNKLYSKYIKRCLDILFSLVGIIVLSPLLITLCVAVRINLGKPVLFMQERPGKNGNIFRLYKFRSMTEQKDSDGKLLPDDKRLTEFGKWLRKTSLDELPELFNILKGEMSFIGPRPLLVRYLPYYTEEEMHRHDVRPGLTGLSQINGRNYTPWNERFAYDLEYVNNISFSLDLRIIFGTIKVLLKSEGIADRSHIHTDENGEVYIVIDGEKKSYPKPLDVERRTII